MLIGNVGLNPVTLANKFEKVDDRQVARLSVDSVTRQSDEAYRKGAALCSDGNSRFLCRIEGRDGYTRTIHKAFRAIRDVALWIL